jgi:PPOX class probable F420-dependent enzyme
MQADEARQFIAAHHRAVLATFRADGRPQLSPVTTTVDASGRVVVSTRETAVKTRNLRRDPRAALCVFTDGFFGKWVQVEGTAEVVSLPAAMDGLVEYYRQASGEHPDWAEYRDAMVRERRVLVRITIERAGPDISG